MIPHDAPQTSTSTPQPRQAVPARQEHAEGAAPKQPLCANPDWPVDGPPWVLKALGGLAA